jgi:hypothetical protein
MPILSVYQAQRPVQQYAETDCFAACGNKQDIQLIKLSIRTGHPVLIGLDGENSIIKPFQEDDEAQSFEALYDTCYTVRDLDRMTAAGVDDPTLIPLDTFRLDISSDVVVRAGFQLAIAARNSGDCRARLRELLKADEALRVAICERISAIVYVWLRRQDDDLDFTIRETLRFDWDTLKDPLTPEGPQWRLLDDDED